MTYGPITQEHERERLESKIAEIREDIQALWFRNNEFARYRAMKAREEQQLECAARVLRGDALDGE